MSRARPQKGMNIIYKSVAIGCITAGVVCMGLLALLSLLFVKGGILPEDLTGLITVIIAGISSFIGAYMAIRISKSNGLIIGGITALILFVILIIAGMICANKTTAADTISKAAVMITSGCIGGIIGVNKKRRV